MGALAQPRLKQISASYLSSSNISLLISAILNILTRTKQRGSKKIVLRAMSNIVEKYNATMSLLFRSQGKNQRASLSHLRSPLLPDDAGDEGGDEEDEENSGEDHDDADGGALIDVRAAVGAGPLGSTRCHDVKLVS